MKTKIKFKIFSVVMSCILGTIPFASTVSQNSNVYAAEYVSAESGQIKTQKVAETNDEDDEIEVVFIDKKSKKKLARKKFTFGLIMGNALHCLGWSLVAIVGSAIVGPVMHLAGTGLGSIFGIKSVLGAIFGFIGAVGGASYGIKKIADNIYEVIVSKK